MAQVARKCREDHIDNGPQQLVQQEAVQQPQQEQMTPQIDPVPDPEPQLQTTELAPPPLARASPMWRRPIKKRKHRKDKSPKRYSSSSIV